jgi:hypothetical protein
MRESLSILLDFGYLSHAAMPLLRCRTSISLSSRKPERSGGYPGPISLSGKFRDGSALARRFASPSRDDSENAATPPPHPHFAVIPEAGAKRWLSGTSFSSGKVSRWVRPRATLRIAWPGRQRDQCQSGVVGVISLADPREG